ncbi:MAG: hypothetical protein SGPRY_011750, partial [Prymnesium sp.]
QLLPLCAHGKPLPHGGAPSSPDVAQPPAPQLGFSDSSQAAGTHTCWAAVWRSASVQPRR